MTTAECIRQRVSCRRFQETPIPREDIRRVVDLARFSPSWKNTQPVRYIVIDDPALKERMARECIPGQGFNTKTINRAAALAPEAYFKHSLPQLICTHRIFSDDQTGDILEHADPRRCCVIKSDPRFTVTIETFICPYPAADGTSAGSLGSSIQHVNINLRFS